MSFCEASVKDRGRIKIIHISSRLYNVPYNTESVRYLVHHTRDFSIGVNQRGSYLDRQHICLTLCSLSKECTVIKEKKRNKKRKKKTRGNCTRDNTFSQIADERSSLRRTVTRDIRDTRIYTVGTRTYFCVERKRKREERTCERSIVGLTSSANMGQNNPCKLRNDNSLRRSNSGLQTQILQKRVLQLRAVCDEFLTR